MFKNVLNDKQTVFAVYQLYDNRDFQIFLSILEKELNECRIQNDFFEGIELNWNQGRCQAIQEILNLSKRIEKMRNTQ